MRKDNVNKLSAKYFTPKLFYLVSQSTLQYEIFLLF